jgi:hypothetical protein
MTLISAFIRQLDPHISGRLAVAATVVLTLGLTLVALDLLAAAVIVIGAALALYVATIGLAYLRLRRARVGR